MSLNFFNHQSSLQYRKWARQRLHHHQSLSWTHLIEKQQTLTLSISLKSMFVQRNLMITQRKWKENKSARSGVIFKINNFHVVHLNSIHIAVDQAPCLHDIWCDVLSFRFYWCSLKNSVNVYIQVKHLKAILVKQIWMKLSKHLVFLFHQM